MNPASAIEVRNVCKTFYVPERKITTLREHVLNIHRAHFIYKKREFKALKNISFEVKKGEFFGIIGRNGSGKSTLLKMCAGIYNADQGHIEAQGVMSPFLELGVGFNPELSGRENIYLNATILGLKKKKIDERFSEIVAFAETGDFIDQQLKYYSSGMRVRLAFSVAIQVDADILLLDEVLAVGDANFQQKCFDIFRKFKKEGKTIVFVSHDLGSIRQFCNRVMYLKDGGIQMIGDPSAVVDHYTYEDRKIGEDEVSDKSDEKVKPVEITRVEFVDKFGNKNKTFLSGDKFTIRVHYKKNVKKIGSPVLVIAIYRDDGTHIYETNTLLQRKSLELMDEGIIEFSNDRLPLIQGKFLITLGFHHEDGTVYDWQDKKFEFYVQRSNSDDGLVALDFKF